MSTIFCYGVHSQSGFKSIAMQAFIVRMWFLLLFALPCAAAEDTVQIDSGWIHGKTVGGVTAFLGIPYAAPPVGDLRWRAPQPVAPWKGVRETSAFGASAPQNMQLPQSEDCLTLNVWRPAGASETPRPVMVWIHGGALLHGSSAIYPLQNMARQGVVMVSMNYRLGRLGYFAHPALLAEAPDEAHSNYGYLDQRAALQWVQRNIAALGGDPTRVTLFGESAGGGAVMAHLVSPMSRGLFQRAILQSPAVPTARNAVIGATDLAVARKMAEDWAASLGIVGTDDAARQQLRALPVDTLLNGTNGPEVMKAFDADSTAPGFAKAIIDGRFLTESPESALVAGRLAPVPVIIGVNDRDLPVGAAASKEAVFKWFGPNAPLAQKLYDPHNALALDELKQQVFADRAMTEPVRYFADVATRAGNPVWLYRFAYVSSARRASEPGAFHASEIPFVMDMPEAMVGADNVTRTDKDMAESMSAYWVQFAQGGNPNRTDQPPWPQHDPAQDRLMLFTANGPVAGADPIKPRLDLWRR